MRGINFHVVRQRQNFSENPDRAIRVRQPFLAWAHPKHDWRVELIEKLTSLQKPDGSWAGEKKWMEDNPVMVTAYCVIAIQEAQKDLQEHPLK